MSICYTLKKLIRTISETHENLSSWQAWHIIGDTYPIHAELFARYHLCFFESPGYSVNVCLRETYCCYERRFSLNTQIPWLLLDVISFFFNITHELRTLYLLTYLESMSNQKTILLFGCATILLSFRKSGYITYRSRCCLVAKRHPEIYCVSYKTNWLWNAFLDISNFNDRWS